MPALLLFVSLVVGTVACGSPASKASSQGSGSTGVKLAACMRQNGYPTFPDPTQGSPQKGPGGHGEVIGIGGGTQFVLTGKGIDTNTPKFQSTFQQCGKKAGLKPPSGAQVSAATAKAAALKLATCMRSHGISQFPDPSSTKPSPSPGTHGAMIGMMLGGTKIYFDLGAIDVNSTTYQSAWRTCQPVFHNALTAGASSGAGQ